MNKTWIPFPAPSRDTPEIKFVIVNLKISSVLCLWHQFVCWIWIDFEAYTKSLEVGYTYKPLKFDHHILEHTSTEKTEEDQIRECCSEIGGFPQRFRTLKLGEFKFRSVLAVTFLVIIYNKYRVPDDETKPLDYLCYIICNESIDDKKNSILRNWRFSLNRK